MAPEILDPHASLCEIEVLGRRVRVPHGDLLLRCFQFLFGDRISYGRFCWNNECGNCEIRCLVPGDATERTLRACMSLSRPDLKITQVPVEFRVFMQAGDGGPGGWSPESGPTRGGGASLG